ncbi:MAG: T9SS type A sorting domain-containing protein [Bacteroidetes bacterium]|nr:T9SS type A sorting domain-containing protein [Bacteroidota bacterium]
MKRGLLFSISGLMIAGALFWMRPATETTYYQAREASEDALSAQGYIEYINSLRRNPQTGKVEAADIEAAKQQLKRRSKNAASLNLSWDFMGPDDVGGRTRAIIFDKDNPSIMYAAGVSGGIFRSPNAGRSWISVDDNLDNMAFVSLAQSADGTIYAGTGEDMYYFASGEGSGGILGAGIYKSTDGGQTFTLIPSTDPATNPNDGWTAIGKLACDPSDANRIYAATDEGLKISNDAGATWTNELSSGRALDLTVTPSGAVWAKVGSRIFKSTNGDAGSFSEITSSTGDVSTTVLRDISRMRIAVSPQDENYVYVLKTQGSNFDRVYQSKDGGTTWTTIGEASSLLGMINQAPFAVLFGVDAYNKERIIVGGLTLWEWSKDNGWFQIASQSRQSTNFYVHVDLHDIKWHPTDTNTIFVTNDGGIFKSTNNGFTWTEENKGYGTLQYYDVAVSLDRKILGGSQDNGTILIDPSSALPKSGTRTIGITQPSGQVVDGDGADAEFSHLDPEVSFKTTQYGRIGRSINDGDEYSYFYGNTMAGRYSNFNASFANFVTPFTLWEKLEDRNSIDSIAFTADTINLSIGFGNGNTRYTGQFTKPQSSTKFMAESFNVIAGGQTVVSDASGTLSGDGSGTFDAATGQFTVEFNNGTALEIRAQVASAYDPGAIITIESLTGEIPITETIPNGLNPGETFMVQDPVQSMFAVGLTSYDNPSQPGNTGGGIWMARDVLSNRTQIPEWWHVGEVGTEEVPTCLAFSHDGDALFVGTASGRVYRFSNLTNARTEETADIDINFLVNPPAPSNHLVESKVIFSSGGGRDITNVIPDTEDPDRLIITLGNYGNVSNIFYTDQARAATLTTSNFINKDGDLPNMPVYDAVFNYNDANGGEVIIGTDFGVFTTDDITANNVSWTQEINGMANVPVFDLLQTRTVRYDLVNNTDFEGAIYAATHGRGVFKTSTTADYVGIEDRPFAEMEIEDKGLELYPNPANERVSIKLNLEDRSDIVINIRDLSGKMVKATSLKGLEAGTEEITLPTGALKTGNYIVSVINGKDVKTAKLVVKH